VVLWPVVVPQFSFKWKFSKHLASFFHHCISGSSEPFWMKFPGYPCGLVTNIYRLKKSIKTDKWVIIFEGGTEIVLNKTKLGKWCVYVELPKRIWNLSLIGFFQMLKRLMLLKIQLNPSFRSVWGALRIWIDQQVNFCTDFENNYPYEVWQLSSGNLVITR